MVTTAAFASAQAPQRVFESERPNRAERVEQERENRAEAREVMEKNKAEFQQKRADFIEQNQTEKENFKQIAEEKKAEFRAELEVAETEEEKQEILKQANAEKEIMMKERKVRAQERKTQAREFISARSEIVSDRLQNSIERGEQIYLRIDSAVQAFQEQGIDTSQAEVFMTQAQASRITAVDSLATASEEITQALATEDAEEARALLASAKESFKVSASSIKELYQSLRSAHGALKEQRSLTESNVATTTETVN